MPLGMPLQPLGLTSSRFILPAGLGLPSGYTMIDSTTYDKTRLPIGTGYDRRPKGLQPSSIIVHTTNGHAGTQFADEANFIYRSAAIGAHFLVGKQGQIAQFLDPRIYRAWHAGVALPPWINSKSIGIECHLTIGEQWSDIQRASLAALVIDLMHQFAIPSTMVETHRKVALPKGRKVDPSEWLDVDFYAWRARLDLAPLWRVNRRVSVGAIIHTQPNLTSPRVGKLTINDQPFRGEIVPGGNVVLDGFGSGSEWVKMGAGFCWRNLLDRIAA